METIEEILARPTLAATLKRLGISKPMYNMLDEFAFSGEIRGNANTRAALVKRGMATAGVTNTITRKGYETLNEIRVGVWGLKPIEEYSAVAREVLGDPEIIATPQDTEIHFIGSGALAYSWWNDIDFNYGWGDVIDNWSIIGIVDDGETEDGKAFRFTHRSINKAIAEIADLNALDEPELRKYVSERVIIECRSWLFDGPDDCDFDAAMADEVLQYATMGIVIY